MNWNQLLIGAGAGMAVAYIFDPDRGRRRRALAADQLKRASRKTRDALDATARDLGNRTTGTLAAARGRLESAEVDDATLVNRVRAKLGRVCSHPRAIEVHASDGAVMLRGPILATELDNVLSTVAAVRGVRSVASELEPHDAAENVPALQGTGTVAGPSWDLLQRNWAPGTQALLAAAGLAATGVCMAVYTRR